VPEASLRPAREVGSEDPQGEEGILQPLQVQRFLLGAGEAEVFIVETPDCRETSGVSSFSPPEDTCRVTAP
jgi:hypothetical protein